MPGPAAWTGTSIGSTPIGQDDAVTAQQILDAYNSVANGGVFVAPRLVRATVSPSGTVTAAPRLAHPPGDRPDHQRPAGLDARRGGDLGHRHQAAIDGYTVAGKTGTAQIPDPNHLGYIPGAYVGSFAGFAPAENPVLSAVVVLDHPTPIYGGAVAAPVFSTIMAYALHHYGIPTTAAATASASNSAVGRHRYHLGAGRSDHGRPLGGPRAEPPDRNRRHQTPGTPPRADDRIDPRHRRGRCARRSGVHRGAQRRVRQPSGTGRAPCSAACRGAHPDGHHYAAEAVDGGATALLCERFLDLEVTQVCVRRGRGATGDGRRRPRPSTATRPGH